MIKNNRVLITGGTGIVGKSAIQSLQDAGFDVYFTTRAPSAIDMPGTAIQADLLVPNGVSKLLDELRTHDIQINHLINNFRDVTNLETDSKGRPTSDQWLREYQAAVTVPFELSMGLEETNTLRSVINISSMYGITAANLNLYDGNPSAAPIHYNVAKAAEIHLTKELAIRLAASEIRVNAIAYGGIEGRAPEEFKEKYSALTPLKGMLRAEDIPGAMLFLLSEEASGRITGQTLQVDGGWTLW